MTRTKPHTVRQQIRGGTVAVKLVKLIGGDWGYTLPSGRRIVQQRDPISGRGVGFWLDDLERFPTLIDACIASEEMSLEGTTEGKAVRLKEATPAEVTAASCDLCGKPIQTRGWINPVRAATLRDRNGQYAHGRCLMPEAFTIGRSMGR